MPAYGENSSRKLKTAHAKLQQLFNRVITRYDNSITEGFRDKETQDKYFKSGLSKTPWPKSKHNSSPSRAVDSVPYPLDWDLVRYLEQVLKAGRIEDKQKFQHAFLEYARLYHYAGYVQAIADELEISIRWGGDWDSDNIFSDQSFHDLPHFELTE